MWKYITIFSLHMLVRSRLHVEVIIVFEAYDDPTSTFFQHFSHILPFDLETDMSDIS